MMIHRWKFWPNVALLWVLVFACVADLAAYCGLLYREHRDVATQAAWEIKHRDSVCYLSDGTAEAHGNVPPGAGSMCPKMDPIPGVDSYHPDVWVSADESGGNEWRREHNGQPPPGGNLWLSIPDHHLDLNIEWMDDPPGTEPHVETCKTSGFRARVGMFGALVPRRP